MFDIGILEVLLICVVALVVVGPERLPGLARTAGLWIGKARRMVAEIRSEVERELRVEELRDSIQQRETTEELKRLAERVKDINTELLQPVQPTVDTDPKTLVQKPAEVEEVSSAAKPSPPNK